MSFDQKFYADLIGIFSFGIFMAVIGKKMKKDTNLQRHYQKTCWNYNR